MRILIVGGTGYVGPLVVEALWAAFPGSELIGLDAGWFQTQHDSHGPTPERLLASQHFKDVRDICAQDVYGYDAIVYLAAVSNDPMGDRFAEVTDEINRRAAVRTAMLAKASGVKSFVFASSASVYGAAGSESRSELSATSPQSAYARSKVAAETELRELADAKFSVTCLRFSTACGWSPRIRLDLVLNDFVVSALTTHTISVLSDGTPWRPLIHVRDMARAIVWSLSVDRSTLGSYVVTNVGRDDWNFQVRDLAHTVADVVGGVEVSINTAAQPDPRSYRVDFANWRRIAPHHQPQEELRDTIKELEQNLRTLPDLDGDFRGSERVRLRRLVALHEAGFLNNQLRWTEL